MPTYDDFHKHIEELYSILPEPKQYRLGQLYFNKLLEIKPHIANELRGSMLDPFYKERITSVVSNFVRERW